MVVAVINLARRLSVRHLEELPSLGHIGLAGLLIVSCICLSDSEITGAYGCRTIDARVCALAAIVLPLQEVVPIAIGTLEHTVEVLLGRSLIFCDTREQIGSDASNTHPGNIVVILVVAIHAFLIPSVFLAINEVGIEVLEHSGILLVASSFESIQNNLEHLCVAPPAAVSNNPTRGGLLVGTRLPFVHHIVALVLCESLLHRIYNLNGPSDASGIDGISGGSRIDNGQAASVRRICCGCESIFLRGALEDKELICSTFHGDEFPRALTAGIRFLYLPNIARSA